MKRGLVVPNVEMERTEAQGAVGGLHGGEGLYLSVPEECYLRRVARNKRVLARKRGSTLF